MLFIHRWVIWPIYYFEILPMKDQLNVLQADFSSALTMIQNESELKELEQEYLGKTGKLKAIL